MIWSNVGAGVQQHGFPAAAITGDATTAAVSSNAAPTAIASLAAAAVPPQSASCSQSDAARAARFEDGGVVASGGAQDGPLWRKRGRRSVTSTDHRPLVYGVRHEHTHPLLLAVPLREKIKNQELLAICIKNLLKRDKRTHNEQKVNLRV